MTTDANKYVEALDRVIREKSEDMAWVGALLPSKAREQVTTDVATLTALRDQISEGPRVTRWYWRDSDESQYWRYSEVPFWRGRPKDFVTEPLYALTGADQ